MASAALAVSMAVRRGTAARVVRIIPVPYSPVTASAPRMAASAWPTPVPVREPGDIRLTAGRGGAEAGGVRRGARRHGDHHDPVQQPAGAGHGAQLDPL